MARRVEIPGTGSQTARWAAELQDGPLQGLTAMRLLLDSAMNHGSPHALQRAAAESVRQIDEEIATLRAMMADMRGGPGRSNAA